MISPKWRELYAEYRFAASIGSLSDNHREIEECALTVALEAFLDATGLD